MRILTVCFVFLFFLSTVSPLGASSKYSLPEVTGGQVDEALMKIVPVRFLPSNPFYFAILFKETVSGIFKPSSLRKADWDFVLCGKRLKEVYLLLDRHDIKNSSEALSRYAKVSEKMVDELNKAKSRNQDVATEAAIVDQGLSYQLILFSDIENKIVSGGGDYHIDDNFSAAYEGFWQIVNAVDQIKPGTRDKFF